MKHLIYCSVVGLALAVIGIDPAHAQRPETVRFPGEDGKTEPITSLYPPAVSGPHPAIVALHGRGGLYSSRAIGYTADTVSSRHNWLGG